MPVISATYLLGTLAAQVGTACFNSHRSTKHSRELAKKQQEYEERVMHEGIENAREEYAELCALQRQIEIDMQQDRLQMLRDNHLSTLWLEAYSHSMQDWPLLVPPFVIKNECLPLLELDERQQVTTIPVNCIMTTSIDSKFNLKIFPTLEENLAIFFSKYWKSNGVKSIRFYQQAWRNNMTDVGSKMRDIKAHLKDVPTIILSPLIEDDKLKFRFYWWGMSDKPEDEHIIDPNNIYDPELSISVKPGMEYTEDDVKLIVEETTAKVAAFVSYFADLYYWNFYHFAPTLPIIAQESNNSVIGQLLLKYALVYENMLLELSDNFLSGHSYIDKNIGTNLILGTTLCIQPFLPNKNIADVIAKKIIAKRRFEISDLNILRELSKSCLQNSAIQIFTILDNATNEIENVEFERIIMPDLNFSKIKKIIKERTRFCFNANFFAMSCWNEDCIIGRFATNNELSNAPYLKPNSVRYFIFVSSEVIDFEEGNILYYKYNINSNTLIKMNQKKFEDQFGNEFARVGRGLGKIIDATINSHMSPKSSVWDSATSDDKQRGTDKLFAYFVQRIDEIPQEVKFTNNLTMQDFLNWLDQYAIPVATKAYILKGFVEEKSKYVVTIFLANDKHMFIGINDRIQSFITPSLTQEIKDAFGMNDICEIPLQ